MNMETKEPNKISAMNIFSGLTGNLDEDVEWIYHALLDAYNDGREQERDRVVGVVENVMSDGINDRNNNLRSNVQWILKELKKTK